MDRSSSNTVSRCPHHCTIYLRGHHLPARDTKRSNIRSRNRVCQRTHGNTLPTVQHPPHYYNSLPPTSEWVGGTRESDTQEYDLKSSIITWRRLGPVFTKCPVRDLNNETRYNPIHAIRTS